MVLISVLRTISKSDDIRVGRAAVCAWAGAGWACWFAGVRSCVAAANPTMAAAPTAYQGYCCVHQRTSAASWAVALISATVRCMAVLASAACWVRNMPSSVVLYRPIFCGTVGNAVSEGGALLELAFVILLH